MPRSLRFVSGLVCLAILGAMGCEKKAARTDCRDEGTTAVLVGPKASQVAPECVILHKDRGDTVYFMATDSNKVLSIEFKEQPFEGMTHSNNIYRISCKGSRCYSGPIKSDAVDGKDYEYTQSLADATDPQAPADKADGHIIIVKP